MEGKRNKRRYQETLSKIDKCVRELNMVLETDIMSSLIGQLQVRFLVKLARTAQRSSEGTPTERESFKKHFDKYSKVASR